MADRDQTSRKAMININQHSIDQIQAMIADDESNTEKLKIIFLKYGWPNTSMVGQDGVEAFFILAQHSSDSDFQRSLLPHIGKAFNNGEIDAESYASFVDRVLVEQCKSQKYGTQIEFVNNVLVPGNIENRENVNADRASIGLSSLEDYLLLAKDAYLPDDGSNQSKYA